LYSFGLLPIGFGIEFPFNDFNDLLNGVIFVLDDLLLLGEENVGVKDVEEETQVDERLAAAVVGQLCTPLEDFVDAAWVGLSEGGVPAGS
jgi:hypothetical protein